MTFSPECGSNFENFWKLFIPADSVYIQSQCDGDFRIGLSASIVVWRVYWLWFLVSGTTFCGVRPSVWLSLFGADAAGLSSQSNWWRCLCIVVDSVLLAGWRRRRLYARLSFQRYFILSSEQALKCTFLLSVAYTASTFTSSSSSLFGVHHQCVAPLAANSPHSGLSRAISTASS